MEHETSLKVASASAVDGASSAKSDPCVLVSPGLLPAVELSTTAVTATPYKGRDGVLTVYEMADRRTPGAAYKYWAQGQDLRFGRDQFDVDVYILAEISRRTFLQFVGDQFLPCACSLLEFDPMAFKQHRSCGHDSTSIYAVPWTYFKLYLGDRSFGFVQSSPLFNFRCF